VQIYGAVPEEMCAAAQWLEAYGVAAVDLNMGCPVHKVTRGGGGSALLCEPGKTIALVRRIVEAVRLPVTVKMRLGWNEESLSAPFFARQFEQAGVAAVTIHGRTRAQGFSGDVNLDGIRAVVAAVERIPVIGNGDIRTVADAAKMLRETHCAAVAIGRGALLNPWIFTQLSRWEMTGSAGNAAGYEQRLRFLERHFHLLVKDRGERSGCLLFRKVANWYCRVLHPGREIQQRLIRIASVADFYEILHDLHNRIAPWTGQEAEDERTIIPVPSGPVERW
jgi:nifR3 family TIM-barrel protein